MVTEQSTYSQLASGSSNIDFGSTDVGSPITWNFQVDNFGDGPLLIDTANISLPVGFAMTTAPGANTPASNATNFSITLEANTAGSYSGTISLPWNSPVGSNFTFTVQGVAVGVGAPEVDLFKSDGSAMHSGVTNVNFGSTSVGVPLSQTVTVTNNGDADLVLDTANLIVPAGFSVTSLPANTLTPGQSASMTVQLGASSAGTYSGSLSLPTNDADENPFVIPLMGVVDGASGQPEITITQDSNSANIVDGVTLSDFGTIAVNAVVSRNFTIANTGDATLTFDPSSVTVPNGFSIATTVPASLAPNATAALTIQASSASTGSFSGTIVIPTNDSDENPFDMPVQVVVAGDQPDIDIQVSTGQLLNDESTLDFGATDLGTAVTRSVTIKNLGLANLTLDPSVLTMPPGYSLLSNPDTLIAPGAETTFDLQFDASYAGTITGTWTITSSDPDEGIVRVLLTGETAIAGATELLDVTIDNVTLVHDNGLSSTDRSTSDPTIAGQVNGQLSGVLEVEFDHDSNGIPDGSKTINAAGETFQYDPRTSDLQFASTLGSRTIKYRGVVRDTNGNITSLGNWLSFHFELTAVSQAEIDVLDADQTALINGEGVVDFASSQAGNPRSLNITIANNGTGDLLLDPDNIGVPLGYTVVSPPADTIAAGASTTMLLQLNAEEEGFHVGTVTIPNTDADESPFTFDVQGLVTKMAPDIEITDGGAPIQWAVDLGATDIDTPVTRTLTIHNWGTADLVIYGSQLQVPAGFTVIDPPDLTVPPSGGSTTLTVQLDANTAGTFLGTFSLSSNDPDEAKVSFELTGVVDNDGPLTVPYVKLINDTGLSGDDGVTFDPTLRGRLTGDLEGAYATIEFDHNGDQTPDGDVDVFVSGTNFLYDPLADPRVSHHGQRAHVVPRGAPDRVPRIRHVAAHHTDNGAAAPGGRSDAGQLWPRQRHRRLGHRSSHRPRRPGGTSHGRPVRWVGDGGVRP